MCTNGLLRCEVINERSRYAQTATFSRFAAAACAIRFNRVEVFRERRMLEVEDTFCGDGIPKPLNPW
jgi:hypothetical protein